MLEDHQLIKTSSKPVSNSAAFNNNDDDEESNEEPETTRNPTTEPSRLKHHPSPKPTKHTKPNDDVLLSQEGSSKLQCYGDCMGGILALFCNEIDSDAFCPGEDSCCIDGKESATSPRPTTPPPAPRCPGFCLLNIMAAFCERPSVILQRTSNCKQGTICCDNTRSAPVPPQRR